MKILLNTIILTACMVFYEEYKSCTEYCKLNFTNKNVNSDLSCKLDIEPESWSKGQSVQIRFTLENISNSELTIAKAITNDNFIWFRLKIEDENGNIILTGNENESFPTDDLPALVFGKLQSKEKFSITKKLQIDSGYSMNIYDLKPGKYFISAVYRFEPEKEPYGAGFYKYESETYGLWTGIIISEPIEVILSN